MRLYRALHIPRAPLEQLFPLPSNDLSAEDGSQLRFGLLPLLFCKRCC
jgi:hypothetical protein